MRAKRPAPVLACTAMLALAACGSNSLSGAPSGAASGTPAPTVSESKDTGLSAKLPDSIMASGVIRIGVDASYPPNEFLAGDGKTVQGFDVDLFNAVAAKFGVRTAWQ